MSGSYYRRLGADGDAAVFESSDHTRSNWTPEIQHGSPPLALLTKAIEEQLRPGMRIGRMTLDILGAIPVTEVRVRARVDRPGSRICLLSAEMSAGRPVARVTAWALATSDTADATTDRLAAAVRAGRGRGGVLAHALGGAGRRRTDHRAAAPGDGGRLRQWRWRRDRSGEVRGSIGPDGIGVTTAELFDRDGFIGTSAQTLLVQRR